MTESRIGKSLLIIAGVFSVGIGTVGIFLPLLPTTPFLLLAAACFIRSSGRLYRWLTSHRWFGPYIRNYRDYKAVTRKTKAVVLILLWVTLGISAAWAVSSWIARVALAAVGAGVTIHIMKLRTLSPDLSSRDKSADSAPGRSNSNLEV
ncbi:MAG: DUF454 family protein [Candidatus Latescibacteria bacterium]|nr:DUF454 family protein [bacterium]MBD3424434.1 DUF454 family protein [Candidatus Latescibacterota bacterium]